MNVIAITQARMNSSRLPGKVLLEVGGMNLLSIHVNRILKSKRITELIIATTTGKEDINIIEIADALKVKSFRGSENDVLDRFYQSLQGISVDYVVRLTSDCPLIDAQLIDKVIEHAVSNNLDYCSNTLDPQYPDGQDIEVFSYSALVKAWKTATLSSEREHVTPFIWKNSTYKGGTLFTSDNFEEGYSYGHLRMTVDEIKDFELISKLITANGADKTWLDYATFISNHSDIKYINEFIARNEGYSKSTSKDQ